MVKVGEIEAVIRLMREEIIRDLEAEIAKFRGGRQLEVSPSTPVKDVVVRVGKPYLCPSIQIKPKLRIKWRERLSFTVRHPDFSHLQRRQDNR